MSPERDSPSDDHQNALRERHDIALATAGVGTWTWHVAENSVEVDPHLMEGVFGWPPERFGGKVEDWPNLIHPEDAPAASLAIAHCADTGEAFDIRYRVPQADGELRWLQTRGQPTALDEAGKVVRVAGVTWNISAEMRVRQERDTALQRIEQATRFAGVGMWEVDAVSQAPVVDNAWKRLTGIPESASLNIEYLTAHIAAGELALWLGEVRKLQTQGGEMNVNFAWHRPDNDKIMYLRTRGAAYLDEQGNIAGVRGIAIDETAEHTARLERDASQTKVNQVLETGMLGFWSIDAATQTASFDKHWRRMVGRGPEWQVSDMHEVVEDVVHPEDAPQMIATLTHVMTQGEPRTQEFRLLHAASGTARYVQIYATPVRDHKQNLTGVAGFTLDRDAEVRARKATEIAMQRVDEAATAAKLGFWTIDAASGAFTLDNNWRRLLGWDAQAALPNLEQAVELVIDEDREAFRQHLNALLKRGEPLDHEYRAMRANDGQVRYFQIRAQAHRDAAGQIQRYNGYVSDQTEAIHLRREAEQTNKALLDALEASRMVMYELDAAAGRFDFIGDVHKMLGLPPGPPLTQREDVFAAVHEDDIPTIEAAIGRVMAGAPEVEFLHRLSSTTTRPEGWQRVLARPRRDAFGKIIGLTGFSTDETESITRRKELEALRARYDRAMEAGKIGSFSINPQAQTAHLDDIFIEIYGLVPGEFDGSLQSLLNVLMPEDRLGARATIEQGITSGKAQHLLLRRRLPGGELRWFKSRGQVRYSATGEAIEFSGASWNVTEMVELTHALERSNKDLEDFAYIASHDLREPLRGIHNFIGFLSEDYGDRLDDEGRNMLSTTAELAERLDTLLEELLHYSRVGRTELAFEDTDLNKVLDDILTTLAFSLNEKSVELRRPAPLPVVRCDRVRVGELLRNLIVNAAKYNDKDNQWIEISCDNGVFQVRDNGIGIAEHNLDRVFNIFKRLHSRNAYGGGTGMGLTIAKQVVERHGGKIWLTSEPGVGTTFNFTLGK